MFPNNEMRERRMEIILRKDAERNEKMRKLENEKEINRRL